MKKSDLKVALLLDCLIIKRDKFTDNVEIIDTKEQIKELTTKDLKSIEVYHNITHNFKKDIK